MNPENSQTGSMTSSVSFNYFLNPYGEQYLYAVNGHLFAQCSASAVYQTHYGAELDRENTLYVIAGTDGGRLPDYLNQRDLPSGTHYVFIELPELLEVLPECLDQNRLQSSIVVCNSECWRSTLHGLELSNYAYRSAVELVQSLGVADNCYIPYRALWRELESGLRQLQWEYGIQLSSRAFVHRQIENLTENVTPALRLRGMFKGTTAALLAGGPSLTSFLPWVIDNRADLVVIAVSRISRLLQAAGITPDIVVSVDPNPISFDVSREMLEFEDTLLVNGYHITPLLLGNHRGQHVYTDSAVPWEALPNNLQSVGPTVTNSALNLAQDLGCEQIILLGVDLCYSVEGYTHALGSIEHAAGPLVGYIGQTVTTNAGSLAETDPPFLHATKALTLQAQRAASLNCRLYNPAPGAAAIPGITHCPLESIEVKPLTRPVVDVVREAVPPLTQADRLKHYERCRAQIDRADYKAQKIIRLARKALELNERLWRKRDQRFKYKLDKIEKELNSPALAAYSGLCKLFGSEYFARLLMPGDASTWSDAFMRTGAKDYYKAYIKGAEAFSKVLQDAKPRIEARIAEESPSPDWGMLSNQWRKDQQCGRVLLWQQRHPEAGMEGIPVLQELEAIFQQQLKGTDARHLQTCLKRGRLNGVIGKANEYLAQRDQDGLSRLIAGLALRQESEAAPLHALCEGYLAELREDSESAIEAYGRIDSGPGIEYGLIRITGLALAQEDYASALVALEHLQHCSIAYAPQLANLLRITGDSQRAIEVYTEYLSAVPHDLVAMTRLGLIYQELGITEGADFVFSHVAQKTAVTTSNDHDDKGKRVAR